MRLGRRAVAFAIFALAAAAPASAETEHITRTFKLGPNGLLWINSFSGRVNITGTDDTDTSVDAIRHGTRTQLDRIKLDISADSTTIRIDANEHQRSWWNFWEPYGAVDTDLDIKVPRRTNLTITLFSAALDVQGVEGSHNIETFSSRVRLVDVAGPVRGRSFSGPFDIQAASWREHAMIDVETFSGRVDVRLPSTAQGTVDFDSFSGQLSTTEPLIVETKRRNRFTGRLGRDDRDGDGSTGTVRVKTFSGNLTIDR